MVVAFMAVIRWAKFWQLTPPREGSAEYQTGGVTSGIVLLKSEPVCLSDACSRPEVPERAD